VGGKMALVKCVECGKEISSEAVSCPTCGKSTNTGKALSAKTNYSLISLCAILGVVIGGGIGYSISPAIPMLGRVPLFHVLTYGTFLKGFDAMIVPYAQASFKFMIFGVIGGLVLGHIVAKLLTKIMRK
jgi:hypothetical protein